MPFYKDFLFPFLGIAQWFFFTKFRYLWHIQYMIFIWMSFDSSDVPHFMIRKAMLNHAPFTCRVLKRSHERSEEKSNWKHISSVKINNETETAGWCGKTDTGLLFSHSDNHTWSRVLTQRLNYLQFTRYFSQKAFRNSWVQKITSKGRQF